MTGLWYSVDMTGTWDHSNADDLLSSAALSDRPDDRWLMVCLYPDDRVKIHAVKNPDEFLSKGYKREDFLPVASILGDMFRFEMATGLLCNRFYPVEKVAPILKNAKTNPLVDGIVFRHIFRLDSGVAARLLIRWGIVTGHLKEVAA